jgi:hypothetical protein
MLQRLFSGTKIGLHRLEKSLTTRKPTRDKKRFEDA